MTLDFLLNYYIIYPIQVMHNTCKDNINFGIANDLAYCSGTHLLNVLISLPRWPRLLMSRQRA